MIDAAQIRAARSLLEWSQGQLAKVTGLSVNAISQNERGVATPQQKNLEKIQKALEDAGVEFLPQSGVRRKDRIVEMYEGPGSAHRLIEDIYKTLSIIPNDSGDKREMLIAHLKEDVARVQLTIDFIMDQIRKRKEAGITHRLLVRANDEGLIPPYDTYHILPDKYFSDYLLYIYGTKLALLAWDPGKSVVIDDSRFADCARQLFNFIWDHTEEVSKEEKGGKAAS
jgi:transcriptional regulator with XRE-family HTH domain